MSFNRNIINFSPRERFPNDHVQQPDAMVYHLPYSLHSHELHVATTFLRVLCVLPWPTSAMDWIHDRHYKNEFYLYLFVYSFKSKWVFLSNSFCKFFLSIQNSLGTNFCLFKHFQTFIPNGWNAWHIKVPLSEHSQMFHIFNDVKWKTKFQPT